MKDLWRICHGLDFLLLIRELLVWNSSMMLEQCRNCCWLMDVVNKSKSIVEMMSTTWMKIRPLGNGPRLNWNKKKHIFMNKNNDYQFSQYNSKIRSIYKYLSNLNHLIINLYLFTPDLFICLILNEYLFLKWHLNDRVHRLEYKLIFYLASEWHPAC